jgi:NAD(P)-dependent dehydrogenase (short-subunit alcohol dehydrogenase family)
VVSGRSRAAVERAVAMLGHEGRVLGVPGDATDPAQLEALYDAAEAAFGPVAPWVDNAGAGAPPVDLVDQPVAPLRSLIDVNLTGVVLGTRVAARRMGPGAAIYNVEGFGGDGRSKRPGMAVYGATKAAVRYFTDSVAAELDGSGIVVGTIAPGVVVTDLLRDTVAGLPADQQAGARRRYDLLGDTVETVAPRPGVRRRLAPERRSAALSHRLNLGRRGRRPLPGAAAIALRAMPDRLLVDQMLANRRTGVHVSWLSPGRLVRRLPWPGTWRRKLLPDTASA